MSTKASIAYKNDDGEFVAAYLRGEVFKLPAIIKNTLGKDYAAITKLVDKIILRDYGRVVGNRIVFYEDENYSENTPLRIWNVANSLNDINYFVKDNGDIVSYDPQTIIQVDTSML